MNEDFFQNISSTGNPIEYADTVQRYQTQLPLGISWPTVTGSLNPSDLYTDDTSLYMYYPSGVNKTAIAIQQRDRYGGITFTLVSGSTNLYIQASEYFADPNPAFISGPYTVSGEGGTNLISASYLSDTPENPENYWINLPNPGTYKVVFPNPVISTAISVTHSGSSPYVFSQMLPRKSVGSYDIDVNSIRAYHVTASFIDAVAIQVSDSIVVGPDLIGAKSIDGSKIIDGTISGVLIRDGTIIGNKILAGTISGALISANTIKAENLDVDKLSAITANMGTLSVTEAITVTSGYMQAGITKLDNTGIAIGSLTTALAASDALRVYGSGTVGNIVGMAFYNGSYSAVNPQVTIQADSTNALEIENNAVNGITNFNFPTSGLANSAAVNIYNGNLFLRKSPNPPANEVPGTIYGTDSDDTVRYKLGPDQLRLNNNTADTFIVDSLTGDITTLGSIDVNAGKFKVTAGNGNIETHGNIHVGTGSHVFAVDGTSGNTAIEGTLDVAGLVTTQDNIDVGGSLTTTFMTRVNTDLYVGYNSGTGLYRFNAGTNGDITTVGGIFAGTLNNKFTVASATGNTAVAGTLGVTGKITSSNMGYLTVRRTADVAITTAGTTITWQSVVRSNNISVSTDTITIDNAGYYMFSATFATLANLASLRMTLVRGTINYVSTLHGAGLSTGGGYIFNFNIGFWATAGSTYKVNLVPSANTTLNANAEGGAAPSPIINIFQSIGV